MGKRYAKYFILSFLIYVSEKYKKNLFCAVINKNNLISINAFKKAGYKLKNQKNNGNFFYINKKFIKLKQEKILLNIKKMKKNFNCLIIGLGKMGMMYDYYKDQTLIYLMSHLY